MAETEWEKEKEAGFLLLTYRHLINLGLALSLDTSDYVKKSSEIMQSDSLRSIDIESLFNEFEKKLGISKQMVGTLREMENDLEVDHTLSKSDILAEPFWKQAIRLRINQALRSSNEIINRNDSDPNLVQEGKNQLKMIIELMKKPMKSHVENQIRRLPFAKGAVNNLKSSLNRVRKIMNQLVFGNTFETLTHNLEEKQRMSLARKKMKLPSILLPPVSSIFDFSITDIVWLEITL